MNHLSDRIAGLMLDRLFMEGAVTAVKVSGYSHIYRMEFQSQPGAAHSQTVVWNEFEDEVQQFSNGWFPTIEECVGALRAYVKFNL